MISHRWSAIALAVAIAVTTQGCSDDGTHYGPPDGLTGKMIPNPTFATGNPTFDAGPAVDAGPCGVSWSTQIFPNMQSTGKWKCAQSSCHGGLQAPKITTDAAATYATLASYTLAPPGPPLPYLLPGNTDPSKSAIECNLSGSSCDAQMPLVQNGATALTPADVTLIDTWVKCGAPDN